MENKITKKVIITRISIVLIVATLMLGIVYGVGRSFGFFKYIRKGSIVNIITIGGIKDAVSINILSEDDTGLKLQQAYPMYDSEGLALEPFEFEITNNLKSELAFSLSVQNDEEKQALCTTTKEIDGVATQVQCPVLSTDYIKYAYKINDGDYSEPAILSEFNNIIIDNYSLGGHNNVKISVIIWIKSEAGNEIQGSYFAGKLVLQEVNLYKELILNGADPVIADNLVPVKISANGTVTKANITEQWYSYENKEWANAVVTFSGNDYENNEEILESDIKQYYVWIPRYKYQLWNVGSGTLPTDTNYPNGTEHESAINIVFESKRQSVSRGSNNGEWLTHPAFTNFNTNGIWVGKFETSYNENSFTNSSVFATSNPNISAVTSGSNIIIKPNVRSLINKDVSTFYTLGREINENLNSHMMTNMEWGAVAYLTYSLYGKCDSNGCEEVYINNVNTGYYPNASASFSGQWNYGASITGCSASTVSASAVGTQSSCAESYQWNEINNKASTTGNKTGIYDMNGGNWEYVMAVIKDSAGNPISGKNNIYNSGFNGIYGNPTSDGQSILEKTNGIDFPTDNRYYNLYTANSTTLGDDTWYKYENGILGDATKEIANTKVNSSSGDRGLWYSDYAYFPTTNNPWFGRGGGFYSENGSGILFFIRGYGHSGSYSFRVTLAY